jgi:LemA protein
VSLTAAIVLASLVVLALGFVLIRNSIIAARNRVDEGWSGIDVQLKRRRDLVPNLVETVKGYAAHEQRVFEAVTRARADALRASGIEETRAAEQRLSATLAELRAVAENYPALRAAETFQRLQADLAEVEDEIQASRRIYNANVRAYNTRIQIFPNSIVAGFGGFTPREYFEIETAAEREPVQVSFTAT